MDKAYYKTASGERIKIVDKGLCEYRATLQAMEQFTQIRHQETADQIWCLQHFPVYTQGSACQQLPLNDGDVPVVKTDRGGQITYHGPGQLIVYPLLNLRRYGLGIKALVDLIEQAVIDTLNGYKVQGERKENAPGVYVDGAKIAALGLRIRKGCSYHGLSLNVDMDLSPFDNIDPCGYEGLRVTQLKEVLPQGNSQRLVLEDVQTQLVNNLIALLSLV